MICYQNEKSYRKHSIDIIILINDDTINIYSSIIILDHAYFN